MTRQPRTQLVELFSGEKVLCYSVVAESKDGTRIKQIFANPDDDDHKLLVLTRFI
jgi:hypothetical protein